MMMMKNSKTSGTTMNGLLTIHMIFICSILLAQDQNNKPIIKDVFAPTEASLRGLHALNDSVVWASGSGGTFLRSVDGGRSWDHGTIVDSVDFRDIYGFDEKKAVIISAGHPALIFKTIDGGKSWKRTYENLDQRIFFDAIDFWDEESGIAFSDAIENQFFMITTNDGGNSWQPLTTAAEALDGEGGFAASGTNMIINPSGEILIGTTTGRLISSKDKGKSWTWIQSLLESAKPTSGIFSIAAITNKALMVGGDFTEETNTMKNAAYMDPSGKWHLCDTPPGGYRSGVAFIPGTSIAICTGPGGTDISFDYGVNWDTLSDIGFHAVSFGKDSKSGWLSGSGGRIARIVWE
jgi:photosystem II stability/assembly factor-like uncharacterized protein